jgi:hypothetical protein
MNQRYIPFLAMGILYMSIACGGIGLAYEHDLSDDYAVWATDMTEQAAIVKKNPNSSGAIVAVDPMIIAYGWNDDFIIAKQHPALDHFDQINTRITHWFIIQTTTGDVYGPLTEEAYLQTRVELGVPGDLAFTQTIKP